MAEPPDYLQKVAEVVEALRRLALEPVLVGGMALVILGSRRVTRDFDFVVARPGDRLTSVVDACYDHGLRLASSLDEAGNVTSTIDKRKVAAIRLRLDAPVTAYFYDPGTALRIDLLFDFPLPAADLFRRATRVTIRTHSFVMASEEDLLQLKRIAAAARAVPGDADDIAFLQARRQ